MVKLKFSFIKDRLNESQYLSETLSIFFGLSFHYALWREDDLQAVEKAFLNHYFANNAFTKSISFFNEVITKPKPSQNKKGKTNINNEKPNQ